MKNKLFISALLFIMIIISISSCQLSMKYEFPEYTIPKAEDTTLEMDDEVLLDGVLDEPFWASVNNETVFGDADLDGVSMSTKCYIAEKGVYFGIFVKDKAVYYSPDRSASRNSSVEIYFAGIESDKLYNLRIVPTGNGSEVKLDQVCWIYNYEMSNIHSWLFKWEGAAQILGEMNTSRCEGYTAEVFLPWETIGCEPTEYIRYMPAFNHVESASTTNSERKWVGYPGSNTLNAATWIAVSNESTYEYEELMCSLIEYDESMKIDGTLDEEMWQNSTEFDLDFSVSKNKSVSLNTKYLATDMGAYFGFTVEDPYIYCSGPDVRKVGLNTGMEIYFAPLGKDVIDENTFQLRITADNQFEKRVGIPISYPWTLKYFRMLSATTIQGTLNSDDISNNTGYTIEIFIPWESFGLSGKQDGLLVYPMIVHAENTTNTEKTAPDYVFCNLLGKSDIYTDHIPSDVYIKISDDLEKIADNLTVENIEFNSANIVDGFYECEFTVYAGEHLKAENVTFIGTGSEYIQELGSGVYKLVIPVSEMSRFSSAKTVRAVLGNITDVFTVRIISD